jgi:DNA end-binding protein Ku
MRRALWKGAISFGLINIPVELFTAEKNDELDFTLLDKRDLSPVGYRRYNKKSGREVVWDDIIKGYEYEDGKFVLLSDEDLRQANVESTQSIDIQNFVEVEQVPIQYYEQPYYLAPLKGGEKAYALLRETLIASGKMAIAQIVIRTRQHLAALLPQGELLNLVTLRYPAELRPPDDLELPQRGMKKSGVSKQEVEMARTLVEHMSSAWKPDDFHDQYRDDVLALIKKKIKTRQTHVMAEPEDAPAPSAGSSGKVIDLMALLKRSLNTGEAKARSGSAGKKGGGEQADAEAATGKAATNVHSLAGAAKRAVKRREASPAKSAAGTGKTKKAPSKTTRTKTATAAKSARKPAAAKRAQA